MSRNQLMESLGVERDTSRGPRPTPGTTVEPAVLSREIVEKNSTERLAKLHALEEQGISTRKAFFAEATKPDFSGAAPSTEAVTNFNACLSQKDRQERFGATINGGQLPISLRDIMVHGAVLAEGYRGKLVALVNEEMRAADHFYKPKDPNVFGPELTAELKKFQGKLTSNPNSSYTGEPNGIIDNKLFRQLHNAAQTSRGKPIDNTPVPNCGAEPEPSPTVSPTTVPTTAPTPVITASPESAPTSGTQAQPSATIPLINELMRARLGR